MLREQPCMLIMLQMETLDLNDNKLTGQLPSYWSTLTQVRCANLVPFAKLW